MRCLLSALSILAVLTFMVSPVSAEDTVEAHLIIEAFDGCGCIPSSPPLCPAPHDLNGEAFGGDSWTYQLNTANPTVVSVTPARGAAITDLLSVQVTFSEAVTGVAAGDLTVKGSAATAVTGSGAGPYTFTGYAAPSNGTVSVVLAAGAIAGGTDPFTGDSWKYALNSTKPVVVSVTPVQGSSITALTSIQVTFSEPVRSVRADDMRVNGSKATAVTGSGAGPYAFTGYTAPVNGTVSVVLNPDNGDPEKGVIRAVEGTGCNVHLHHTYEPHGNCPVAGAPFPYPNFDYFGDRSLDQDWWNHGFPVDYLGSHQTKNGSELDYPPNQGSQGFSFDPTKREFTQIESANIGYISPAFPQEKVQGFGRMVIEPIRLAYNANFPDIPLPDPIPGQRAYIAYDAMRQGDGFGGTDPLNPLLAMRADLIAVDYQPVPSTLTWTWESDASRMLPADGKWHTYRIGYFSDYPEKFYLGIGVRLDASSQGFPATMTQNVTVHIDNLRVIYRAEPFPENCSNGVDDDGDTLADCADPDCDVETDVCPCNRILKFDPDRDTDVDQEDFAQFQLCYTGSGYGGELTKACKCYDVTGPAATPDGSVDQQDFGAFDDCSSGPEITASASCDGLPDE